MAEVLPNQTGAELIARERERQLQRYSIDHDVFTHEANELAHAANVYIVASAENPELAMDFWPWSDDSFHPGNDLENYIRAGALIAAEIDRLLTIKRANSQCHILIQRND